MRWKYHRHEQENKNIHHYDLLRKKTLQIKHRENDSWRAGGIAEYFDIDPTLVRLGYVLLSLFSAAFPGVLGYIIMWIVMPQNPDNGAYPNQPPRFQ